MQKGPRDSSCGRMGTGKRLDMLSLEVLTVVHVSAGGLRTGLGLPQGVSEKRTICVRKDSVKSHVMMKLVGSELLFSRG